MLQACLALAGFTADWSCDALIFLYLGNWLSMSMLFGQVLWKQCRGRPRTVWNVVLLSDVPKNKLKHHSGDAQACLELTCIACTQQSRHWTYCYCHTLVPGAAYSGALPLPFTATALRAVLFWPRVSACSRSSLTLIWLPSNVCTHARLLAQAYSHHVITNCSALSVLVAVAVTKRGNEDDISWLHSVCRTDIPDCKHVCSFLWQQVETAQSQALSRWTFLCSAAFWFVASQNCDEGKLLSAVSHSRI